MLDNIPIKVDEAGRVLVPQKVRKKYDINSNDTLLLTTNEIGFEIKKENTKDKYQEIINKLKEITKEFDLEIIVTDDYKVIYANSKYEILKNKKITPEMKKIKYNEKSNSSNKTKITKDFILTKNHYYSKIKLDIYTQGIVFIIYKRKKDEKLASLICSLVS